jgi:hypothetical protein
MKVTIDMRIVRVRDHDRVIFDIHDETSGKKISLAPQPHALAFDLLEVTLVDLYTENTRRETGPMPALKPTGEGSSALLPKIQGWKRPE